METPEQLTPTPGPGKAITVRVESPTDPKAITAALRNALPVVGKTLADARIVVSGVGAAGSAIIRLLLRQVTGTSNRRKAVHTG